jgi:hypothetical protein
MRTKPVSFPFPVADTSSGPAIQWENGKLTVGFSDYEETPCRIIFDEVSHFEWLAEDELDSKIFAYDGVVEVIDSTLIDRLVQIGVIAPESRSRFRHLVIGFNEVSAYLVVVCNGWITHSDGRPLSPD